MNRPWRIWLLFALCLAVALGGLGWITVTTVSLDQSQAAAQQQALIEENTRLALWRMDSEVLPVLMQENARPYYLYSAYYMQTGDAEPPLQQQFQREQTSMQSQPPLTCAASPLSAGGTPFVKLYFQVDPQGTFTSPQAPSAPVEQTWASFAARPGQTLAPNAEPGRPAQQEIQTVAPAQAAQGAQEIQGGAAESAARLHAVKELLELQTGVAVLTVRQQLAAASAQAAQDAQVAQTTESPVPMAALRTAPVPAATTGITAPEGTPGAGPNAAAGPVPPVGKPVMGKGEWDSAPTQSLKNSQEYYARQNSLNRAVASSNGVNENGGGQASGSYPGNWSGSTNVSPQAGRAPLAQQAEMAPPTPTQRPSMVGPRPAPPANSGGLLAASSTPPAAGDSSAPPYASGLLSVTPPPRANPPLNQQALPNEPASPEQTPEQAPAQARAQAMAQATQAPQGEAPASAANRGGPGDQAAALAPPATTPAALAPPATVTPAVTPAARPPAPPAQLAPPVVHEPLAQPAPSPAPPLANIYQGELWFQPLNGTEVAQVGTMQPIWQKDRLLITRRVDVKGQEFIQGAWLDWPALRTKLLQEVSDLLPNASLEPLASDSGGLSEHRLALLPVRVVPGEVPGPPVAGLTPVQQTLLVAWIAILVAALAGAALLGGVMALSERRAAFVSAVTHELRTPLTTFRMYTEMLEAGMVTDTAKREKYLATMRAEAVRLSHLVENVLAYARLERTGYASGTAENTRLENLAPGALLARMQDHLAERAAQAGLRLQVAVEVAPGTACAVRSDPGAVEQILFNLVDNACKYAQPAAASGSGGNGGNGGGEGARPKKIAIRAAVRDGRMVLEVRDFGPGIAADQRGKLFRPFSRSAEAAANSATRTPGVGLGLALSRRLARAMGGELTWVSTVQDGACFELALPLAEPV